MKILHTADWHLGKRLDRYERIEEQRAILSEICGIAEREEVDVVLIAGDLYDTYNPPIEATDIFFQHLKRLSANGQRAVVAIAGNHDSPHRIEAPDPLARACGILFSGFPDTELKPFALDSGLKVLQTAPGFVELKLPKIEAPLRLLLTPYANESRLRRCLGQQDPDAEMRRILQDHWAQLADQYCDTLGVNLLVAHLFMIGRDEIPPDEPEDEKPINIGTASAVYTDNVPDAIQYVALGHLHRYQNMKGGPCPCVYSSSILEYSFAEAGQDKYVVLIDAEPGQPVSFRSEKLRDGRGLHRETFDDIDVAVEWLQANSEDFVELTILTDSFITGVDRKRLVAAHKRIIGPIPCFTNPELLAENGAVVADLSRSREALFEDYFLYRRGVSPGDEILDLFREITGKEAEL
ncbi:MAG TPA: exonuclease subunit SbcD [Bacteroidetes bacterium]|nr:exonuclease subunit SbcD [Bacteroidota bacterium]